MRRFWTGALLAFLSLIVTSPATSLAETTVAVVTEPDGVNLRAGPGTQYSSLRLLPKDTELQVSGAKVNDNWLPVVHLGTLGFVFDAYVELRVVAVPLPMPATMAPPAQTMPLPQPAVAAAQPQAMRVNAPDGVNLRAGPSTDQRILTVIPHGASVTVTGRSSDGKWASVTYSGQSGWIDAQYLIAADQPLAAAEAGGARYIWPVAGRSITTYFSAGHPGVDVDQFPAGGNPVVAVAPGTVIFAGGNRCCSYGLYVKVQHTDGTVTLSAHLQSVDVREGQEVAQGETLGRSGNTGYSTGAHLHFEMHINGGAVDPLGYLGR